MLDSALIEEGFDACKGNDEFKAFSPGILSTASRGSWGTRMNLLTKDEIQLYVRRVWISQAISETVCIHVVTSMMSGTKRFLVADEVGLGKTYVAKGDYEVDRTVGIV